MDKQNKKKINAAGTRRNAEATLQWAKFLEGNDFAFNLRKIQDKSTGKKRRLNVQSIGRRKGDKISRHSVNYPFVQIENKLDPGSLPPPVNYARAGFSRPFSSAAQCLVLHRNWTIEPSL